MTINNNSGTPAERARIHPDTAELYNVLDRCEEAACVGVTPFLGLMAMVGLIGGCAIAQQTGTHSVYHLGLGSVGVTLAITMFYLMVDDRLTRFLFRRRTGRDPRVLAATHGENSKESDPFDRIPKPQAQDQSCDKTQGMHVRTARRSRPTILGLAGIAGGIWFFLTQWNQ